MCMLPWGIIDMHMHVTIIMMTMIMAVIMRMMIGVRMRVWPGQQGTAYRYPLDGIYAQRFMNMRFLYIIMQMRMSMRMKMNMDMLMIARPMGMMVRMQEAGDNPFMLRIHLAATEFFMQQLMRHQRQWQFKMIRFQ